MGQTWSVMFPLFAEMIDGGNFKGGMIWIGISKRVHYIWHNYYTVLLNTIITLYGIISFLYFSYFIRHSVLRGQALH